MKITDEELKQLQNYPLDKKIKLTKQIIKEWYEYNNGNVYVSFSGGKDSTVLLDIVRSIYPNVPAVFCNTTCEFPELLEFVKSKDNVTILTPEMTFEEVIKTKGYPIVSKSVANCVRLAKKNIAEGKNTLRMRQIKGLEKGSIFNKGKWEFLLNAPFEVSEECCKELKTKPVVKYEKETGKKPIVAIMANEGRQRGVSIKQAGFNNYKKNKSTPMGFWLEQDVLEYILTNKLEICSVYGDIIQVEEKGKMIYKTTGEKRTGCIACGMGCHLEKEPNRFQRLKKTHPNLYNYIINELGYGKVLDYIGVKY